MYDWDSDGSHDMIGGFTTTVEELAASQHGKEVGAMIQIRKIYLRKILIIFLPINLNMCFGCSKEPSH